MKAQRQSKPEYRKKENQRNLTIRRQERQAVITIMGGKCVRCDFSDPRALQIDHIYGDGYTDRKKRNAFQLKHDILAGKTQGLQLLCANCNWIKRAENNENAHVKRTNLESS